MTANRENRCKKFFYLQIIFKKIYLQKKNFFSVRFFVHELLRIYYVKSFFSTTVIKINLL